MPLGRGHGNACDDLSPLDNRSPPLGDVTKKADFPMAELEHLRQEKEVGEDKVPDVPGWIRCCRTFVVVCADALITYIHTHAHTHTHTH